MSEEEKERKKIMSKNTRRRTLIYNKNDVKKLIDQLEYQSPDTSCGYNEIINLFSAIKEVYEQHFSDPNYYGGLEIVLSSQGMDVDEVEGKDDDNDENIHLSERMLIVRSINSVQRILSGLMERIIDVGEKDE